MKNVLILNGSPRKSGNTMSLIKQFVAGAEHNTNNIEIIHVDKLNLNYCTGCLRCNMLGRCGRPGDDWENVSDKIDQADVLVFASPVYFHHVSAQLKKLIDRFRSLVHVQITENGLIHTPVKQWKKEVALVLTMGSSDDSDAQPAIDMFQFILEFLSPGKELHVIKGTRLAVINQLEMVEDELRKLYIKIGLPEKLADSDYGRNLKLKIDCKELGRMLTR